MSLFRRPAAAGETRSTIHPSMSWSEYLEIVAGRSGVSESSARQIGTALQHSVVHRCVFLVAGIVATLPVHAKRGRVTVEPKPRLLQVPSSSMRWSVWAEAAVASMLLRGGAYGLVDDESMGRTGWPSTVDLVHPDRVDWSTERGWTLDSKPVDEYPLGPLWQVPLHVLPGSPKGLNPLEFARRSVYAGLAAQEFGGNFFRDGGHPSAILAPEQDPGEEGAKLLKRLFRGATQGTNREVAVIPQSIKYHQLQVNPEDSQFIDLMRFTGEDLCRFFGVDPAMAGVHAGGSSLTYTNLTDRREDLKQFSVLLPMQRLEEAIGALLPGELDVRFNVAGLLRASLKDRYDSYKVAAEINQITGETFMAVHEMRDLEDWEPLPAREDTPPRSWQPVGLPALVDDGILTPNEAREELGKPPRPGGDVLRDPPQGDEL